MQALSLSRWTRDAADRTFVVSAGLVAASTIVLPWITGYGTVLFQIVVLGGWAIVARVTSGKFADLHHEVVWPVVLIVNVLVFSLPVMPFWAILRKRLPTLLVALIVVWGLTYIGLLFFLVPATDGP